MTQSGNVLLTTSSAVLSTVQGGTITELSRGKLQVVIVDIQAPNGQRDQYLVVDVAGVEMAIATDMQVITQGAAYLWPPSRHPSTPVEKGSDGEGFIKLEFQSESVEERETWENILNGWTTFQNPQLTDHGHSRLVLVDEGSGDILGDLAMPYSEDKNLQQQIDARPDKEPVIVDFDGTTTPNGSPNIKVRTLHDLRAGYGQSGSKLVGGAEYVSRGILYGAEKLSSGMSSAATSYTSKSQPTSTPLVFHPTVKTGITKVHDFSSTAFEFTSKTLNAIVDVAGSVGTRVGGLTASSGTDKSGQPKQPGAVRKYLGQGFQAVNTLLDSIEVSTKHVVASGSDASTSVVGHKWGEDAASASRQVTGSLKNVVVVYIDARGVARKALVKGFGKSAVQANFGNQGGKVVLQPEIINEKDGLNATNAIPLGQHQQSFVPPQYSTQPQSPYAPPQSNYANLNRVPPPPPPSSSKKTM